ncbi:ABC transporter permease subunit [Halolamina sp. CBA1230]|uniref:ABC transporter permease n=1 Tax=Halolamina sp. CBA1230 TaxID=1853690 RepID=UPI0009A1A8B2|nr:ABC transporter permease subunit [Halolamina sp. CBA1230]QKY19292.1 ABC transporter permease subunit [Halolamina sp. CBA1230]
MSWAVVARKELRDVWGSRRTRWLLWGVAGLFLAGGYAVPLLGSPSPTSADFASFVVGSAALLVSLVGLLLGHRTIVGERASGELALLLSLPYDRLDVVVGKFLARWGALGAAIAVGVVGGAALTNYPFGSFEVGTVGAFLLGTLLYGAAFVGVGLAISTATTSTAVASSAAFGVFVLFVAVWSQLRGVFTAALDALGLADGTMPDWALFLYGAEPGMLYRRLVNGFFAGVEQGPYLGPDAPWYLGEWVAAGLLVVWALGPATLGYLRFRSTDL